MKLNRRNFLKGLGTSFFTRFLPKLEPAPEPEPEPVPELNYVPMDRIYQEFFYFDGPFPSTIAIPSLYRPDGVIVDGIDCQSLPIANLEDLPAGPMTIEMDFTVPHLVTGTDDPSKWG